MVEYLEYLKINNFEEYLELKAVFEEIHIHDNDTIGYMFISIPLVILGFFGIMIGYVERE